MLTVKNKDLSTALGALLSHDSNVIRIDKFVNYNGARLINVKIDVKPNDELIVLNKEHLSSIALVSAYRILSNFTKWYLDEVREKSTFATWDSREGYNELHTNTVAFLSKILDKDEIIDEVGLIINRKNIQIQLNKIVITISGVILK